MAVPVLSKWQIEDLLRGKSEVSFDLEISRTRVIYGGNGTASFEYGPNVYEISLDELPEISEESCEVYALIDGSWRELSIAGARFYKLCVFGRGWAPTLMIDGITMHSVLENPLLVTRRKVRFVRGRVFECCTGLGYTAIEATRRGARQVVTVEADPNVLLLASYNPYSRGLFSGGVDLILDDATRFVEALKDAAFDYVIHDPPRLSHATQVLYSEGLYREYARILKPGGGLFHYTGASGSKYRGVSVWRGVAERLRSSGFIVKAVERGFGVYAVRASPRRR
nr:RsmD family RNA methyltransferase [Thermoproteus uzoniensis]